MGDYPGLSQCNHKGSYKREAEGYVTEGDETIAAELRVMWVHANECRQPPDTYRWYKSKDKDFPLEPPEGKLSCQSILDF